MKQVAFAWLLECAPGLEVAVGAGHVLELIEQPSFIAVPRMSQHALGLILWRGKYCAAVSPAKLCEGPLAEQRPLCGAAVVYVDKRGLPAHGVVGLASAPRLHVVRPEHVCARSRGRPGLWRYSESCFMHRGEPVSVMALNRLFGPDAAGHLQRELPAAGA